MKTRSSRSVVEKVLRSRFPTAVVRASLAGATFGDRAMFDVFRIPEERGPEFMKFVRAELPDLLSKRGVDPVMLLPISSEVAPASRPATGPGRRKRTKPRRRASASH